MYKLYFFTNLWAFLFLLPHISFVDGATNVTVDNLDDRIVFFAPPSKKWTVLTNNEASAIDGSVSVTYTAGLYFYFQFEGTAIYIVGQTFEGAASFTPSVDGVVIADNIAGGDSTHHLAPFWGVGGLTAGTNHTLNVTIGLNPNVTTKSNFELDALIFTTNDDLSDTITSTVTSLASGTTSAGSSTTVPVTNSGSSTPRKASNVAPIVGGIVGGVAFLVICLVTWMCLRRRSLRHPKHRALTSNSPVSDINESYSEILEEAEVEIAPRPFLEGSTAPSISQGSDKASGSRPTSGPAGSTDTSLSTRILREMTELRVEVARLRDSGNVYSQTESVAPPDYDTLSQVHH